MINTLQSVSATPPVSATSAVPPQSSVAGGEDRFLKLLVAQMQNQDPLNPMDNAQVTSQMAQINTVKGIETLNTTLSALLGGFNAAQPLQAASLVGHAVLAPGSSLTLQNGEAQGGAVLAQSVDSLTVTIKDANGRQISTVDLGPQEAGMVRFAWDGSTDSGAAAANGMYQFSLSAQAAGQKLSPDPLTVAQVVSVTPGEKGVSLSLAGLGDYSLAQIKQIF
jgi:flagellar basal-body rod modification protein FlgD